MARRKIRLKRSSRKHRKSASAASKIRSNPGPDDVSATVSAIVGKCVARAVDQSASIQSIGSEVFAAVGELVRDATPSELLQKAHTLRALVLHGQAAFADLQCVAGQLSALAAIRETQWVAHDAPP
jgi:hypothetical protein